MKLNEILTAVKIGAAVGKSLLVGKVAKTLEKVEEASDIAKAVAKLVKKKK